MTGLTSIISAITAVFTAFIGWFADMGTALVGNEIVLLVIGLGVVGIVFAFVMSLIGKIKGKKRRR